MKLTFLRAANGRRFSKTITKTDTGFVVDPYPNIREMDSATIEVATLAECKIALSQYSNDGWCLLKGNTKRQLVNESRQGSHNPMAPAEYIVLDWDKVRGVITSEEALALIGLSDLSHIYQPSASAAYQPVVNTFSAHQFAFLSKPVHPGLLKSWLIALNLDTPALAEQLELTADGRGLRYKLDITTCQNDKLIFIARPTCEGFTNLLRADEQFVLNEGPRLTLDLDLSAINVGEIAERQKAKIMELRKLAGMSVTKTRTKQMYNREVITNPDEAMVTGIREQGAFIRLNINNGDSWAYWHPIGNWEVVYSFKDEQAYQTKTFLPEYYSQCSAEASNRHEIESDQGAAGLRYIGFLDRETDAYYRGTWNPETQDLTLHTTSGRDKLENFFKLHNLALPEILPEWDYHFDFADPRFVDFDKGFINRYVTPKIAIDAIMAEDNAQVTEADFPTIDFILSWVMAADDECVARFYNWLACKFQLRVNPHTAWLFQGTTGTGKGKLFHLILTALFGIKYVGILGLRDLTNRFNRFDQSKVLMLVDEADMEVVTQDESAISASLKSLITEPYVEYEGKGQQRKFVPNFCSYIFTSNQPTPVHIEYNDRRFNVAPRQEDPLPFIEDLEDKIAAELPFFARFLMAYEVNMNDARTPLINQANIELRRSGLSSLHEIAAAVREGDFDYFVSNLPQSVPVELVERGELIRYVEALKYISQQPENDDTKISREMTEALFHYLDDRAPRKNKFTTMMKRQGLPIQVLWAGERSFRGYRIHFHITPATAAVFERALKDLAPGMAGNYPKEVKDNG